MGPPAMLDLTDVTLRIAGRPLLEGASLRVPVGTRSDAPSSRGRPAMRRVTSVRSSMAGGPIPCRYGLPNPGWGVFAPSGDAHLK